MLARHINLGLAALENVARNPGSYAVAGAGLVAGLTLLLAGIALSEGLRAEALAAVDAGPDVYCTWDVFGRDASLPDEALAGLDALGGVERIVPRIIGRTRLGEDVVAVIGVPLEELHREGARSMQLEGALPRTPEEVLVGAELARALGLRVGSSIGLDAHTVRLFTVSGIAATTASLWSAKAVVCDLAEARIVFGVTDRVSDVCIYTRDGYAGLIAEAVERRDRRFRVQTKELVAGYVGRGHSMRGGVFTALFALALALAVLSFAAQSYQGTVPRRREIGLLKAEGWSTADVLQMVALENLLVSLCVALLALALAFFWVAVLRAPLLAPFFLPDLGAFPAMELPARFTPLPLLLAFLLSATVTMAGSIPATLRTARTRPAEALR